MATYTATGGYGSTKALATGGFGELLTPVDLDDILQTILDCCERLEAGQATILAAVQAISTPSLNRVTNVTNNGDNAGLSDLRRLIQLYRKELQETRFNGASQRERSPRPQGRRSDIKVGGR